MNNTTPIKTATQVASDLEIDSTQISLFKNVKNTAPTPISVGEVIEQIRSGTYAKEIGAIRQEYSQILAECAGIPEGEARCEAIKTAKKERLSPLKKQLPAVTFSGDFSERKKGGLKRHSGLCCMDLDDLGDRLDEVRKSLIEDPAVFFLFTSPTGNGLKVIYRIPAECEGHTAAFFTLADRLRNTHQVECDQATKDVSRLCFASYDRQLYYNPDAPEVEIDKIAEKAMTKKGKAKTEKKEAEVARSLSPELAAKRRTVAESLLTDINWKTDSEGYVACPGADLHGGADGDRDCRVMIDEVPNVYCFHKSCRAKVAATSAELLTQIRRAETPEIYYASREKGFWVENNRKQWIPFGERAAEDLLAKVGWMTDKVKSESIAPSREELLRIRQEQDVVMAGSLAGYRKGMLECDGRRILITDSPSIITPLECDWSLIQEIIEFLFSKEQCIDQRNYVYGWLQIAYRSLATQSFQPGQALAIAGDRDCGKNLFQDRIITPLLGNRVGKPYRFMTGGTEFNADLFQAEHLMIQDETAAKDPRSRRAFGSMIKNVTVNRFQQYHAKGRDAITLRPLWRLSISLNREPEDLQILPPFDESISDKIMLLNAVKNPWTVPNDTLAEREAFDARIQRELPGFCHFLLNEFEIPRALQDQRFGVATFHHPELINELEGLSPEQKALDLIDHVIFKGPNPLPHGSSPERKVETWKGKAIDLEELLLTHEGIKQIAQKLLYGHNALANHLGRLKQSQPERVESHRTSQERIWKIHPPIYKQRLKLGAATSIRKKS